MSKAVAVFFILVLMILSNVAYGDSTVCNGPLSGQHDEIIVDGGSCSLDGATVNGSVLVSNDGELTVMGGAEILGDIQIYQGGDVDICDATVDGSVKVTETDGNVEIGGGTCVVPPNIDSILVEKGTGNVRVVGAVTGGSDLLVIEQEGDILVDGAGLSDITIEKSTGRITLINVTTDSDTTITENDGNVTIRDSAFVGDVEIKLNRRVIMKRNRFSFEDVKILNNTGRIVFTQNVDLNVSIVENNDVKVRRNTITDAEISKNTGGVSITKNSFMKLNCSDNDPLPTGSGNVITELADGQCAGF